MPGLFETLLSRVNQNELDKSKWMFLFICLF